MNPSRRVGNGEFVRLLMLLDAVRSRMLTCWITGTATVLILALGSTEGRAVPIQYSAEPGSIVSVQVQKGLGVGATDLLPVPEEIALQATSTITIDDGTDALLSFSLLFAPGTVLELSEHYGGYDEITLNSVEVFSGPGFAVLSTIPSGSGYSFTASGVDVEGEYVAADSGGLQSPTPPTALPEFSSLLTGAYEPATLSLSFDGVQIALIDGAPFGETLSLLVQGSFSVTGGSPVVIPEPSTGILLAGGLVLLGSRRRSESRLG